MIYKTFSKATKIFLAIALLGFSSFSYAMEKGEELESYTTGSSILEQSLENLIKKSLALVIQKIIPGQKVDSEEAVSFAVLPLEIIDYMLDFVEVPSKEFHFLKMYLQKQDSQLPKHIKNKLAIKIFFKLLCSTQSCPELSLKQLLKSSSFYQSYFYQDLSEMVNTIELLQRKFDVMREEYKMNPIVDNPLRFLVASYHLGRICHEALRDYDNHSIQTYAIHKQRVRKIVFSISSFIIVRGLIGAWLYSNSHDSQDNIYPTIDQALNGLYDTSVASTVLLYAPAVCLMCVIPCKLIRDVERNDYLANYTRFVKQKPAINKAVAALSSSDIQDLLA